MHLFWLSISVCELGIQIFCNYYLQFFNTKIEFPFFTEFLLGAESFACNWQIIIFLVLAYSTLHPILGKQIKRVNSFWWISSYIRLNKGLFSYRCASATSTVSVCASNSAKRAQFESRCLIIKEVTGCFSACHALVDAQRFFNVSIRCKCIGLHMIIFLNIKNVNGNLDLSHKFF